MSFDNKKVYEIAKAYVKNQLGNFDLFVSLGGITGGNTVNACRS